MQRDLTKFDLGATSSNLVKELSPVDFDKRAVYQRSVRLRDGNLYYD